MIDQLKTLTPAYCASTADCCADPPPGPAGRAAGSAQQSAVDAERL